MPEFILNESLSPAEIRSARGYGYPSSRVAHPYHALTEFAQGYVEAMFFTNGDTGNDKRENHLNELGTGRLTRAAVENIAKDCAAFYETNEEDLESAAALVPGAEGFNYGKRELTDQRLGNLFWYARQGHGVGFTDDGDAACLDNLQRAARKFCEAYCEVARGWIYHR